MRSVWALPLLAVVAAAGASGCAGAPSGEPSGRGDDADRGASVQDAGTAPPLSADAGAQTPTEDPDVAVTGGQGFGLFRRLLDEGRVPRTDQFDAAGFFAQHDTALPPPTCGMPACIHPLLAAMPDLIDGAPLVMLQLGVNAEPVEEDERPPLALAVVVDVSGSMGDAGKLEFVREGLSHLVDRLQAQDELALVTYSDKARVAASRGPVEERRGLLADVIDGLEPRGGTNLFDGLQAGYQQLGGDAEDAGRQRRVVLLSDGQPTAGVVNLARIKEMSAEFNARGIHLTTVGLGTSFNYELMSQLALNGDGNFYVLEEVDDVRDVFDEELAYTVRPAALNLQVRVQVGSDYLFGRAYGSPQWSDAVDGGNLHMPSLFAVSRGERAKLLPEGGRHTRGSALLLELTPRPPEEAPYQNDMAQVAALDVEFTDAATGQRHRERMLVDYPDPAWNVPARGFFDEAHPHIAQKSFVMLSVYRALERASALFYDRRAQDAVEVLHKMIAVVLDYNSGLGHADLQKDVELMKQMIEVITLHSGELPENTAGVSPDPFPAN